VRQKIGEVPGCGGKRLGGVEVVAKGFIMI
jgi:hypothetical protein